MSEKGLTNLGPTEAPNIRLITLGFLALGPESRRREPAGSVTKKKVE
jgi:hypothetical protein